jgi:hypothetical protein
MLFPQRFRQPIADGTVTLTFRRWRRPQALPGRVYRTPVGRIAVERVDVVDPAAIGDADARRAGFDTAAALLAQLPGEDALPVYRIQFHAEPGPDPRDELAAAADLSDADVAELDRRLDRLDAHASAPWTAAALAAIAARPATRAAELAADLGRERLPFKADVRKLKALGLTISLERGYRLSPRGEEYLRRTSRGEWPLSGTPERDAQTGGG